jgi:hypothetical protein
MTNEENRPWETSSDVPTSDPNNAGDGGASQVEEKMHEEQEKGYRGYVPDTHPNSEYTVAGVLKFDKGRGTEPEQMPHVQAAPRLEGQPEKPADRE